MSFQSLVQSAQQHFPNLQIKYKDESTLMKIIGKIMFFNKGFMTSYTTTLGSTIYYPSRTFVRIRPISASIVLLHEIVHIYDSQKLTQLLFSFLYLCPQLLVLLAIPLLLISWKLSLLALLFAAPIPSYFRMYFEKRAYFTSLYALNAVGHKMNFDPVLDRQKDDFIKHFKGGEYYFMWPFNSIESDFDQAIIKVKNNERPFESSVFDILDNLVDKV